VRSASQAGGGRVTSPENEEPAPQTTTAPAPKPTRPRHDNGAGTAESVSSAPRSVDTSPSPRLTTPRLPAAGSCLSHPRPAPSSSGGLNALRPALSGMPTWTLLAASQTLWLLLVRPWWLAAAMHGWMQTELSRREEVE
jgi:hypothetical protein